MEAALVGSYEELADMAEPCNCTETKRVMREWADEAFASRERLASLEKAMWSALKALAEPKNSVHDDRPKATAERILRAALGQ